MAKTAKPLLYPDSVRPPPALPDAQSVRDIGFDLSDEELMTVRTAMAIHAASRQPKLTWTGWRQLALALYIGTKHAKKASKGKTATPLYIRAYNDFLKKSGLVFINHNDRAAAVRLLPYWDEIDDWRGSLEPNERRRLNNPREVWDTYVEHRKALGDPNVEKRAPLPRKHGKRQQKPSWLEQMQALAEQLDAANERAERAERESEYFAALMDAVAKLAKMDDDDIAEIRAKVRAAHAGEGPD